MKIAVFGLGYVGPSNAVFLAKHNEVVAVDITRRRATCSTRASRRSSAQRWKTSSPSATGADYMVIATPTNYDVGTIKFDNSSVEKVIRTAKVANSDATIVIKSTIPVGLDLRNGLDVTPGFSSKLD